jgi:hypothetical protein
VRFVAKKGIVIVVEVTVIEYGMME